MCAQSIQYTRTHARTHTHTNERKKFNTIYITTNPINDTKTTTFHLSYYNFQHTHTPTHACTHGQQHTLATRTHARTHTHMHARTQHTHTLRERSEHALTQHTHHTRARPTAQHIKPHIIAACVLSGVVVCSWRNVAGFSMEPKQRRKLVRKCAFVSISKFHLLFF